MLITISDPRPKTGADLDVSYQNGYNQYPIDNPNPFGNAFALFYNATDFAVTLELISLVDGIPVTNLTFNVPANGCQYVDSTLYPDKNILKATMLEYDSRDIVALTDQFFASDFQACDNTLYNIPAIAAAFGSGMTFLGFTIYDPTKNGFTAS